MRVISSWVLIKSNYSDIVQIDIIIINAFIHILWLFECCLCVRKNIKKINYAHKGPHPQCLLLRYCLTWRVCIFKKNLLIVNGLFARMGMQKYTGEWAVLIFKGVHVPVQIREQARTPITIHLENYVWTNHCTQSLIHSLIPFLNKKMYSNKKNH